MRHTLPDELSGDPLEAVRSACAQVAERARYVHIARDRIEHYAATLPCDEIRSANASFLPDTGAAPEELVAFGLELDTINFGSGYFPLLKKRPQMSGYRTLEACLTQRFAEAGSLSPHELRHMSAARCAEIFEQTLETAEIRELMGLYAQAWRELGERVEEHYAGSFMQLVSSARGSASALVQILLEMPLYRDISTYAGFPVPFLKRAQLCAADLTLALPAGPDRFTDLYRLTAFADNLVPHVLRLDGILQYDPELLTRIESEELIPAGSAQEVEIRACAVHAVELLVAELTRRSRPVAAHQLDSWLWQRGGGARYKAQPRHRTRCPYY